MAVVAITTSGAWSIRSFVAASSSLSSERHDPQGRRVQYGGPTALEQRTEFVCSARGRDSHGEPREGAVLLCCLLFVVHRCRPAVCRLTYMPTEPVNGS